MKASTDHIRRGCYFRHQNWLTTGLPSAVSLKNMVASLLKEKSQHKNRILHLTGSIRKLGSTPLMLESALDL